MQRFTDMKCVACRRDAPKVAEEQIAEYLKQTPEWTVLERDGIKQLERVFKFKNFAEAIRFTNIVAEAAEAEDHHPAILTEWGRVTVTWWTHKIGGLHQNDFIMAAKTDALY